MFLTAKKLGLFFASWLVGNLYIIKCPSYMYLANFSVHNLICLFTCSTGKLSYDFLDVGYPMYFTSFILDDGSTSFEVKDEKKSIVLILESWLCNKKGEHLKPMVNALLHTRASAKAWLMKMIETIKDTETASLQ